MTWSALTTSVLSSTQIVPSPITWSLRLRRKSPMIRLASSSFGCRVTRMQEDPSWPLWPFDPTEWEWSLAGISVGDPRGEQGCSTGRVTVGSAEVAEAETNKGVIKRLYEALDRHDGEAMAACYRPDARFHDPAFGQLEGREVGGMWRMLTSRADDLSVELAEHDADGDSGTAHW